MDSSFRSSQSTQKRGLSHSQRPPLSLAEVKRQLDAAVSERCDIIKPIRTVLKGLKEGNDDILKEIFIFSINQLNGDELINSKGKELIGLLLPEVDKLQGSSLIELSHSFIEGIKDGTVSNGRSIELFPKILSTILNQKSTITAQQQGGANATMSGRDWKCSLVNSFFSCKWSPSCVLHVVNVSRDSPLESEELQLLIEKLLRVMKTLPVQELPPLIHQLLLVAKNGQHSLILTSIKDLFNQTDKESDTDAEQHGEEEIDLMETGTSHAEVLRSEGTALLHVDFALKQNQELSKEFWKLLKVSSSLFYPSNYTPFILSLALSQSNIIGLGDTVMDNLKAIIVRCLKEKENITNSYWMLELSEHRAVPDINEIFLHIVENSVNGWDLVMKGLINLAFSIFDSFSPKNSAASYQNTPQTKACILGGNILIKAFKSQSFVRSEVLTQLTNRILTSSTVYAGHYISILAEMTRSSPQVLLDVGPQLKEVFSYIMCIPSSSAVSLIKAILPLVQFRASYRDSLLLTLRKSLFSKEIEARCAAVGCSLLLAKNFKVLDSATSQDEFSYSSQSQTLVEVHTSGGGRTSNESICLEILSMLRRSFTHQEAVRLTLYESMPGTFSANVKLSGHILDLLLDHFNKHYYEDDEDLSPPLKLSCCIVRNNEGNDTYMKREPLSHLLNCIQLCTKQCIEWEEKGVEQVSHLERLKKILRSISRRLSTCDLDDFELDKSGDYQMSSSVGSKNHLTAALLLEIYEVVMDYTFSIEGISQVSCDLLLNLFLKYQLIVDVLTDKGGPAGKKNLMRRRLLSSSTILLFLKALFRDTLPAHQVPLAVLRDSTPFVQYILTATLINIKMSPSEATPWCWSARHDNNSIKNYQFLVSIAKILYGQLERPSLQQQSGKKRDKGKSVASLCLECFSEICHMIVTCYKDNLISFAREITEGEGGAGDGNNIDDNEQLHIVIRHFQQLVASVVVSGRATGASRGVYVVKDVALMVSVISALTDHLDRKSSQCSQVFEWLDDLCRQNNIEDHTLTKSLFSFLLTLQHRINRSIKNLCKMAPDIHFNIGDIEEDVELSGTKVYSIITPENVSGPILTSFQHHLDFILVNIENILNVLKLELKTDVSDSIETIEEVLGQLCDRLHRIAIVFTELAQSAIPPGPPTDTLVKNLVKFYSLLSEIVKQQAVLYGRIATLHPKFVKAAESIGSMMLSQKIYLFLIYWQRIQQESMEQAQGKKGKGKGKVVVGMAQVKREKRSIPKLIYWIEDYENQLIQLGKKSKHKLMDSYKRSVSRDFQIKDSTLNELLNNQGEDIEDDEGDMEVEENGGGGEDSDCGGNPVPKSKRLKRET